MSLYRDDELLVWHFQEEMVDVDALENSHPSYFEALPRYLTFFDHLFEKAKAKCEFSFICSILMIKSEFMAENCDPFQSTSESVPEILNLIKENSYSLATEHLWLWLYGHIVEASAPYELLYNLISIASGGNHNICNYGKNRNGNPLLLHEIHSRLSSHATQNSFSEVMNPIKEVYVGSYGMLFFIQIIVYKMVH